MPWKETNPVLERHHFAHDLESGQWTMTELCLRYCSRNTGYKWLDRYGQEGPRGVSSTGAVGLNRLTSGGSEAPAESTAGPMAE